MCNHDCPNCIHPECINDAVTISEIRESGARDRESRLKEFPKNPYSREWARRNPEKSRETAKRYYYNNIDKCKAKNKAYYHANKEKMREYNKAYVRDPEIREKRKAYMKEYYRRKKGECV